MSLATRAATAPTPAADRASIVEALAAIPSVVASASAPDVPTEGATWPVWDLTEYAGKVGAPSQPAYFIYRLLPAGYTPETVDAGDRIVQELEDALWGVGRLEYSEPVRVRFDDGSGGGITMPAVRVRLILRS